MAIPITFPIPIIFHSHLVPHASPVITGSWIVPPLKLLVRSGALGFGSDVNLMCSQFIWWCLSQQPDVASLVYVDNLPGIPWNGTPWSRDYDHCNKRAWYDLLIAELSTWEVLPILVNVDELEITQGGIVLWEKTMNRESFLD
jgi:hypothetical protein